MKKGVVIGTVFTIVLFRWCLSRLKKRRNRRRAKALRVKYGREVKTFEEMPYAGWWYLFQLVFDSKNANRKLYELYKHEGLVRVKGITLGDEVAVFDLHDVNYCMKHEGEAPGGAGDILFNRLTRYFQGQGPNDNGLGIDSHGARMFGKGIGHNKTRDLVMATKMVSTPAVLQAAKRAVNFVTEYEMIMDWIQLSQIDMFTAVMIGTTPDLSNPGTNHPLRHLPKDEEKAFVSGLLLSVLPEPLTRTMEKEFVIAMGNMTGLGVKELREQFLALPEDMRPESFMKSLLESGTANDAEELMALFITAFQGNIALTLQNFIFHVSTHPRVQDILYQEILQALNTGDHMKANMPYMQAIFMESHRLTPITDFTQVRTYEHDLVLPSGWELPANTKLMFLNKCSTRDPELVPNVKEFIPERFIGSTDENIRHFLQRSEFGGSTRSCLGRRTARIMLRAVIVELFSRYRLEAAPMTTSFVIDTEDPSFNRIKSFPKILLHPR